MYSYRIDKLCATIRVEVHDDAVLQRLWAQIIKTLGMLFRMTATRAITWWITEMANHMTTDWYKIMSKSLSPQSCSTTSSNRKAACWQLNRSRCSSIFIPLHTSCNIQIYLEAFRMKSDYFKWEQKCHQTAVRHAMSLSSLESNIILAIC